MSLISKRYNNIINHNLHQIKIQMEQDILSQEQKIKRAISTNYPRLEACSSQCFKNGFRQISSF